MVRLPVIPFQRNRPGSSRDHFSEMEKIDIQSPVLIGPFSVKIQTRNGREMAIRPTKKADF